MQTMAQEWIEEGIDIGKKEGIIAQRQILLNFLSYRFSLSEQQLEICGAPLQQIDDLDRMTQLLNQTLTAQTLTAFEQTLQTFLPKEEPAQ